MSDWDCPVCGNEYEYKRSDLKYGVDIKSMPSYKYCVEEHDGPDREIFVHY